MSDALTHAVCFAEHRWLTTVDSQHRLRRPADARCCGQAQPPSREDPRTLYVLGCYTRQNSRWPDTYVFVWLCGGGGGVGAADLGPVAASSKYRTERHDRHDDRRYDDRRDRYDRRYDRYDRYDDRDRYYDSRRDDRRGGYDDRRYDDRRGGYDGRRDRYDDRRGGYDDRRGGYDDRRGGYDDRRGGYDRR